MTRVHLQSPHSFHIPVMGTGFTIDTPLRVAQYGISSVVALADDTLIEEMRKYHSEALGLPFAPIAAEEEDARARRITAYLDFLREQVEKTSSALRAAPFEPGSEITRYFEMLPDSPLKAAYHDMLSTQDPAERLRKQEALRTQAIPGDIDVNIMAKVDGDVYHGREKLPPEYALGMSCLRGFAKSTLESSLVLSAGMNQRLYGYMTQFADFYPDAQGKLRKRIVLKVSDYRSAEIQGKYLAKRGLWVSEYRIESGLNCGGHAFASKASLLGPTLEEFRQNRESLLKGAHDLYAKAIAARGGPTLDAPLPQRVTAQGGVGTAEEHAFLLHYYQLDSVGWGTPFLLVPEATNVDDEHLVKLMAATEKDVFLSESSPLGVPFWTLRESASENARRKRIEAGMPGSPCTRGLLKLNTEFGEVGICSASHSYLKRKLADLNEKGYGPTQLAALVESALAKACICVDLAGGVSRKYGTNPNADPAICCGPNIVHFSKLASLEEMVGHIYGRLSLLAHPENRPHVFLAELKLYIDHLRKELDNHSKQLSNNSPKYFAEFKDGLINGVKYYSQLASEFKETHRERFLSQLEALGRELGELLVPQAG